MAPNSSTVLADRLTERRRSVALARHYREYEGLSIRGDRGPSRSVAADDQSVLLRPYGREGAGGQGPLPGRVPGLRRLHPAAQRQGRRLRVLQGLPPGRDRAALDPRARGRGDARVAPPVRDAAVLVRVVGGARAPRGGEALRRLNESCWPSASVVTAVWGSWSAARGATGAAPSGAGLPSDAGESREVGDWAQSASLCPIPGNPQQYPRV